MKKVGKAKNINGFHHKTYEKLEKLEITMILIGKPKNKLEKFEIAMDLQCCRIWSWAQLISRQFPKTMEKLRISMVFIKKQMKSWKSQK